MLIGQKFISTIPDFKQVSNNAITYKRVIDKLTYYGNHCKLVIVDDNLCYIGSENAYPTYNMQLGLWIDDTESIKNFIDKYWTDLWSKYST